MQGQQLHIENNIASTEREIDGHRITITVERLDGGPVKQEDVQVLLTNNILTMFTQRKTLGGHR